MEQIIKKSLLVIKNISIFLIGLFMLYFVSLWLYDRLFGVYIYARFSELGPLSKHMPVFYKGYKVGKTVDIKPDEDYKYTNIKIIMHMKKQILPKNTSAKVQKLEDGKNYIELIYPEKAVKMFLKKGDVIEGKTAVDIESFMSAQADSGTLTKVTNNIQVSLTTVEETGKAVGDFFELLSEVLEENRENLKQTTVNAKNTTKNLSNISAKLDKTLAEIKLNNMVKKTDNSLYNLQLATQNVVLITQDIEQATKDLDKTVSKIDKIADDTKDISSNIKCITHGIKQALAKKFAGMRLIFGKPIE